jgi:hypothetical protein
MPLISSYPEKTALVSTDHLLGYQADGSVRVFPGTAFGGGGGTPGGSSGQLQFNSSSAFAGMSGTSWDDTNRSLTMTGATVTTSTPVLDMSQTWNAAGVTFTGIKFNITNTASATPSYLMDLQVATVSQFSVSKSGAVLATDRFAGATFFISNNGNSAGLYVRSDDDPIISMGTGDDVCLKRDGASLLALRKSTLGQTFRVYNTYTDASNYARMAIVNGNQLKTEKAGTGGDTVTVSTPVLDLAQTWNAGAVTFTGIKMTVTNTASASTSKLMELLVGSSSYSSIRILNSTGSYWIGQTYMCHPGNGSVLWGNGFSDTPDITQGVFGWIRAAGFWGVPSGGGFEISSTDNNGSPYVTAPDCRLVRDAAGIFAQRNSTNAQALRVYNTFTDLSNYERGVFGWTDTANSLTIGTQAAGTGTLRAVAIKRGNAAINLFTDNNIYYASGAAGSAHVFQDSAGAGLFNIGGRGVGYPIGVGTGGAVTQATSKSTGVTLDKVSGRITMNAASLAANTTVSFLLTCFFVDSVDVLILNHVSGGTLGSYTLNAHGAATGSITIDVRNVTAGALAEAIVIQYALIKGTIT